MDKSLIKCRCGSDDLDDETMEFVEATIIECSNCGRMVGGVNRSDAAQMWNTAMSPNSESGDGNG